MNGLMLVPSSDMLSQMFSDLGDIMLTACLESFVINKKSDKLKRKYYINDNCLAREPGI